MRKKKPFLNFFLVGAAFFLAMDCTCAWAYAGVETPAAEASSMPDCHGPQAGQPEKSAPQDCCGKCQIEHSAIIQAPDFSRQLTSFETKPVEFSSLSAENFSSRPPRGFSDSYLNTGDVLYDHLHFSLSLARAPPAA